VFEEILVNEYDAASLSLFQLRHVQRQRHIFVLEVSLYHAPEMPQIGFSIRSLTFLNHVSAMLQFDCCPVFGIVAFPNLLLLCSVF